MPQPDHPEEAVGADASAAEAEPSPRAPRPGEVGSARPARRAASAPAPARRDRPSGDRPSGDRPTRDRPSGNRPEPSRSSSWRPAKIHRFKDLEQWQQIAFVSLLVALALIPLLSAVIAFRQGWRLTGDNALIGLRVHDVLTGHLPLIGQPSTGENYGSGVATNHPGPIQFYLLAPFALILGPKLGIALGAAAVHAAGLVGIAWLAFRRGGLGLMLGASVAAMLMCRSYGGNLLHDPLSSNAGAVVALTLLFATWCLVAGDLRTAPVFVLSGSFALQAHLSYLGTGAPMVLLGIGFGIWWFQQIRRRSGDTSWMRTRLLGSVIVGVILWLPVLWDELFGTHNLTGIVKTFTTKGKTDAAQAHASAGSGVTFAARRLAESLAPWPIFSRRVPRLGYLHTPAPHEMVGGYIVLVAVLGLTYVFWKRRRTDLTALGVAVAVACLAGFLTSVKLPAAAGIKEANLRWMWTVSAFVWVALLLMAWTLLPKVWREVAAMPSAAIGSVALVVCMALVVQLVDLQTDRDGVVAKDTTSLIADVERALPKGSYRVQYAGDSVVLTIGPAVVADLDHRGDHVYVDIGDFGRAYGDRHQYHHQDVAGTLLVTSEADQAYPSGTRLLARRSVKVNRNDADLVTVRVYLVAGP